MAARKRSTRANAKGRRSAKALARRRPAGQARSAREGTRNAKQRAPLRSQSRADAVLTRALRALRRGTTPTRPQARALEAYLGEVYGVRGLSARERSRRALVLDYFRRDRRERTAAVGPVRFQDRAPGAALRDLDRLARRWTERLARRDPPELLVGERLRIVRVVDGSPHVRRWSLQGYYHFATEDTYEEDRDRLAEADEDESPDYWLGVTGDTLDLQELLEQL